MAVRLNAGGEYARRTTDLPGDQYTMVGWCKATRRGGELQYFGFDNNSGYNLLGWSSLGVFDHSSSGTAGAAVTEPSDEQWFFWYLGTSGSGANLVGGIWRLGTDTAMQASTEAGSFTPTYMTLGNESWDENMNAAYAHVKVWAAELSATELLQEMWSARPRRTANLHLWSPLIADTKDYSGNGRNWTEAGTPTYEDGPPVGWGASPLIVGKAVATSPRKWFFGRIS